MDYRTEIVGIGELARELLETGSLIVFNEGAPPILEEVSFLHSRAVLEQDVQAGDVVILGDKDYVVAEVGFEANTTLRGLGHCTFVFRSNGDILPGAIRLEGNDAPDLQIGDRFEIIFA